MLVRVKMFKPSEDNFGTRWQQCEVDDYGNGKHVFSTHRLVHWTKFRVATMDNSEVLQENLVLPPEGLWVEPYDVITVEFVIHAFAFRVRRNTDMDPDDRAMLELVRLRSKLRETE